MAMTNANEPNLNPAPGYILVQLGDVYSGIKMPEGKYDTRTDGIVLKVNPQPRTKDHEMLTKWAQGLIGKRIYWMEFREGKRINFGGQPYATIRIEDVESWEE